MSSRACNQKKLAQIHMKTQEIGPLSLAALKWAESVKNLKI